MTDLTSPPSAKPTATTDTPHRGRRIVGFVLVAVGVIIASVLAVWYFAEPGDTEPGDTEAVFDFEQNTLCDWFTADQMDSIFAEALDRAELDTGFESFATSGSCQMFSAQEAFWSTSGFQNQSDGGIGIILAPVVNDPRGEGYRRDTDPADFEHHAVLDENVTFGNYSDGFAYSYGAQIQLRVAGHEDEVLFLGFGYSRGSGSTFIDTSPHGAAFALVIADIMLEEMNWTD